MKISKLYCNTDGFKNTTFNLHGINVVYADVKTERTEKKNSHDIGKTKLAELIDFALLKGIDKHHFLLKALDKNGKSIFAEHVFYLELLLNSGQFLTIKRGVLRHTKISFCLSDDRTSLYTPPLQWAHESISLAKAKRILGDYINLDFFDKKHYDYRKAISYSIRTQGDYDDVYKLSKFVGGADIDWKPFMFDLLGFDGKLLHAKYKNDNERNDIKKMVDELKSDYSVRVEDRDDIVAQVKLVENKAHEAELQIDKFNFYEQDNELISKNVEEVESEISELNTYLYDLSLDVEKLGRSIGNKFSFDLGKIKKIFNECEIYFSDQLVHDYDALVEFNKALTSERNKLLRGELAIKEEEVQKIKSRLFELNHLREEALAFLQDTATFKKFKYYQKSLVKVEGELLQLNDKLRIIDVIIGKEDEREKLLENITKVVATLKQVYSHTEHNKRYSDIRKRFSDFYKKIMDEDARISWSINSNNNVDFIPPKIQTKGDGKRDTAKDEGRTYKKMLCVAFDLAILCAYSSESYFRFVYHDDVLSQQDNGIKLRLIDAIGGATATCNIQYIFSAIKADLPIDANDKPIYFSPSDVVLSLHDKDPSGTLFGFEF